MTTSGYRKKKNKEFYLKTRITNKLVRLIKEQVVVDNRFYLFKKVLSGDGVTRCLHHLPRSSLHVLEEGRKYAQDGNLNLQKALRNEFVQFCNKARGPGSQLMVFREFLLKVASTLGMIDAKLAEHDKLIQHEIGLEVFH